MREVVNFTAYSLKRRALGLMILILQLTETENLGHIFYYGPEVMTRNVWNCMHTRLNITKCPFRSTVSYLLVTLG